MYQSRGRGDGPAPPVRDLGVADRGEELAEKRAEVVLNLRHALECLAEPRAEVVRGAAAADGDAPVLGAHRVEDQEAQVAEHLVAAPADLVPEGVGERLGADHQRVDRHHRALVAGELGRERFGGTHDDRGAHVAEDGRRDVRLDTGDGGALEDGHPQALDDVGESAGQAGRVDGGAVRREACAEAPGHLDALAHVGGAEHDVVVLAEPPLALVLDRLAQPEELNGRGREVELAAEPEPRVDALRFHDARDLVHRLVQGALLVDHGLAAMGLLRRRPRAGKGRVTPAAVAAGGAEAGGLALEDGDAQMGIGLLEIVGRPETREAGADDGHIDVGGPGERRTRDQLAGDAVEPHTAGAVVGHARLLRG